MKKQLKKLTLNRETLRDLAAMSPGEVKGGKKKATAGKPTACGLTCPTDGCTAYCQQYTWYGCW